MYFFLLFSRFHYIVYSVPLLKLLNLYYYCSAEVIPHAQYCTVPYRKIEEIMCD